MTGECDVGSTPQLSEELSKEIENSYFKIIPEGKHLCNIECSDKINLEIKKHIENA